MSGTQADERERLKCLLRDTVTLLCRNSLVYKEDLKIEAVIGITVDEKDVVLVHINEEYPIQRVLQHNISSSSGCSRSSTPATTPAETPAGNPLCIEPNQSEILQHSVVSEQTIEQAPYIIPEHSALSGESDDTCTAARLLPISHHRGLKRLRAEEGSGINFGPDRKVAKIRLEDSESSGDYNTDTGSSMSGAPELTVDGTVIKEENSTDSKAFRIKIESEPIQLQPLNQELFTVEVADLKFVAPSVPVTAELVSDGNCGQSLIIPDQSPNTSCTIGEVTFIDVEVTPPRNDGSTDPFTTGLFDHRRKLHLDQCNNQVQPTKGTSVPTATPTPSTESNQRKEDAVSKYPSTALWSKTIKECLQTRLVVPLVEMNHGALAARVTWRSNPEQSWNQIVRARQECDMTIGALDGVSCFLSAVTGLSSHSSAEGRTVYPAISYWIAFDKKKASPDYSTLVSSISELDFGCDVKSILPQERAPTISDMCTALYTTVKDYKNTCVRRKVDHSTKLCFGTAARRMPCVKFIVNNANVKDIVKLAHQDAQKVQLESMLESWV